MSTQNVQNQGLIQTGTGAARIFSKNTGKRFVAYFVCTRIIIFEISDLISFFAFVHTLVHKKCAKEDELIPVWHMVCAIKIPA
ncbi:hypothetical protein HV832_05240 [Undibacterium oligocarboniphilum]|uniref:Uncharacterized protein n=1 Tax=Undibacterium oligocarboniphilum TaxID=666702 RepID=A0A850QCD2_9BURK|nr:hypothetical protein [Undibacterium oligocarboniphilum]MBC3869251.1 hypothetical protein [Undibacterium oligocarboniphilum]NVO77231.1 hypothetical protein [Undibacterium oligocarboniphilum]